MTFTDRIGLALVAPRRAFAASDAAAGRPGGLGDAFLLLGLKFLVTEVKTIVAALWLLVVRGEPLRVLTILAGRMQAAIGTDVLLILVGGVIVTVAAGARRQASRDLDLGGVAWVPFFALGLVVELAGAVLRFRPGPAVADALKVAGFALWGLMVGLAVLHARARRAPAP